VYMGNPGLLLRRLFLPEFMSDHVLSIDIGQERTYRIGVGENGLEDEFKIGLATDVNFIELPTPASGVFLGRRTTYETGQ